MPLRIAHVHTDRLLEQVEKWHNRRRVGDKVKGIVPLRVLDGRIRTVRNEEVEDVEVAVACSPLHWCCHEVASEGVDIRTLLKQVAACSHLSVDSCPV